MEKQDFGSRMEERWRRRQQRHGEKGRMWLGLFLLIIGGLYLAKASGVLFPAWFFTGPVLLIGIGLFIGVRHRFRSFGWAIPILIGGVLLADKLSPDLNLRPYLWPVILIAVGLLFIFRPKGRHCRRGGGRDDNALPESNASTTSDQDTEQWAQAMEDGNDVVDVTAVFGGVKKNVVSKNFKGGDVVSIMGGTELNLTAADFNGKVIVDSFNMFGGTKLIVPPDWEVQSNVVTIFGGVDDKRPPVQNVAVGKVLYLDGTCLFGGIEIKSY